VLLARARDEAHRFAIAFHKPQPLSPHATSPR
jgi:excinuclease UvrABC nuclease subunit